MAGWPDRIQDAEGRTMSAQVTVTLPEDVLHRAELWARRTGRPVADFLAQTIELSLCPLGTPAHNDEAMVDWTNEEVRAAAEAQLAPTDDQRLSALLDRQQAGALLAEEQGELLALMQTYQEGLLRKARALREAVRRGLRDPLQP